MKTRIDFKIGLAGAALAVGLLLYPQSTLAQDHANSPPPLPQGPGRAPTPPAWGPGHPPGAPPLGTRIDPAIRAPAPHLPFASAIDPNTGLPLLASKSFPEQVEQKRLEAYNIDSLPLEALVADLRPHFREINFVLPKSVRNAADISLNLKLHNVSLRDILNAIIYATDAEVTWDQVGDNMVVFQVRSNPMPPTAVPPRTPPAHRTAQVINLARIWGGMTSHETQELIEQVRMLTIDTLNQLYEDFNPREDMAKANYHPGTGVLVLVGPDYANKVFMDILKNIDPRLRPNREEKKKTESGAVEPPAGSATRR